MTTDFERQLEQMIPLLREKAPVRVRTHSHARVALGFALGVLVTYCCMQSNDSLRNPMPQESYKLVLDESGIEHLRTPADVTRCIVRVPIPKPEVGQTVWHYGALRKSLMQF